MPRKPIVFLALAAFALAPLAGVYCSWSCAGEEAVERAETAVASQQDQVGAGVAPAVGTDDACRAYEFQPAVPARLIAPAPVATSGVVERGFPVSTVVLLRVASAITLRRGAPPGAHLSFSLRI